MSIPRKVRAALHERAGDCCEICGVHGANNAHHRRNQSQGGRDTLANLLLLCGSGCTGCHGRVTLHPSWATENCYTIQGLLDGDAPETVPVLIRGERCLLEDNGSVVVIPPVTAVCPDCPVWARNPSHFPDRDGAEQFADRHTRMYAGHVVDIQETA